MRSMAVVAIKMIAMMFMMLLVRSRNKVITNLIKIIIYLVLSEFVAVNCYFGSIMSAIN